MTAPPPAVVEVQQPILLIIGIALFAGTLGAQLFVRLKIPQVVGYIVIGLLIGKSMPWGFIGKDTIDALQPFSFFALGVIGFMIGGELHWEVFKKHGWQFMKILLAEGMVAAVVVGLAVSLAAMALGRPPAESLALGLMLGAIASATAPAATVDVLWEYKTRGVLTTTVFAIVALDDGLALLLFGVAASVATILTGRGEGDLLATIGHTAWHLLGAVLLGAVAGFALNFILRRVRRDKGLVFILGFLALVLGVASKNVLDLDMILAAMSLGATLTNLAPRRSHMAFQIMEGFSMPIYVLFFVLVGAQLKVNAVEPWMWWLAGAYVAGRTGGKFLGAWAGARWARSPASIRRYLGLTLFSQAGVAIGLSILASARFAASDMGNAIITIVTATTFIVQIIGPPCVKLAVRRAGEVGLNVTEEDLVLDYKVADVMDRQPPTVQPNTKLGRIVGLLAETEANVFPVVGPQGRLAGVLTLQELRAGLGGGQLSDLLVAFDLMQPAPERATPDMPLAVALQRMQQQDVEFMPVVEDRESGRLVGMIERRGVNRLLTQEILRRRQLADGAAAG
jgi:Kef-type K+ transport system membrane component KefB/predicted transcriptional regulator